ncbi:MAG: sulfotransferase [Pseudomonadota bacterium]
MTIDRSISASQLRRQAAALLKSGQARAAEGLLRRALALEPGHIGALSNLGAARRRLGDLQGAIACYRQAMQLDRTLLAPAFNLANALKERGDFAAAIDAYLQVLDIEPGSLVALNNLGIAYKQIGQSAQAEAVFRRALKLAPAYGAARRNLAAVHEDNGNFDAAQRAYLQALQDDPNDARALAKIIASKTDCVRREHLDAAERLLGVDGIDAEGRAQLHYGLGKYHDRNGDYPRALTHFRRANGIKADGRTFSAKAIEARVTDICDVFARPLFERLSGAALADERPVFIVGMPRTGTTLTEQILSSHPRIAGAGELPYFGAAAADFRVLAQVPAPFPRGASSMQPSTVEALAKPYLAEIDRLSTTALRVTDKMPQNFFYLGLIALLFSSARIVHCWRDPRDVCLSCFVEDFNSAHGFASDPRHFAAYYKDYSRLMAHWRKVLPLPIFDLRYEDMVADAEGTSRALLDFVGCDWDDRCLRFYEQKRVVATPSRWQVRQPIYSDSVGRWRHYRDLVEPVSSELSEAAAVPPGL